MTEIDLNHVQWIEIRKILRIITLKFSKKFTHKRKNKKQNADYGESLISPRNCEKRTKT